VAVALQRPQKKSFVPSGKAPNYRDPTTVIGLPAVGMRCFSEAGIGEDEVDANGALKRGGLKRSRGERVGVESAGGLLGDRGKSKDPTPL
jgi:hypothetical protein